MIRILSCLTLLVACSPPPTSPGGDTGSPPIPASPEEVPLDWGIERRCETSEQGGYGAFYGQGQAVLVIGESDAEAAFADQVLGWYSDSIALTVKRASELSEADRQQPLWVLGSPSTNALLQEMNGHLPVWFEADRFTFGEYRWEERGHGIALMHPSPFAERRS